MYVCGITPYDTTHLGHAFTYVVFDTLARYFQFKGWSVRYAQNVTDIDDDILRKAKQVDEDWKELGARWTRRFIQDTDSLNVLRPTYFPRATEEIPHIVEMTQGLPDKGYAYEKEGNVQSFLKKLRGHVDGKYRNRMLLAESNQWPEDAAAYFGDGNECHMAFHFPVMPRIFMALQMEDRLPDRRHTRADPRDTPFLSVGHVPEEP